MLKIGDPGALQHHCAEWRCQGKTLALLPTMGHFHAGHERVMRRARELADKVIVSVYVNPGEFASYEDPAVYPRNPQLDLSIAEGNGVDLLFTPADSDMYPEGYDTWLEVPGLSENFCGISCPEYFRGVGTLVLKLFILAMPSFTVFGQKDWQLLAIIRRMATDLHLPSRIEAVPTAREADGLAMSSRNTMLGPAERAAAPHLYKGLGRAQELYAAGERNPAALLGAVREYWAAHLAPGREDYLALVDRKTLAVQEQADAQSILLTAAHFGTIRIIDNLLLA